MEVKTITIFFSGVAAGVLGSRLYFKKKFDERLNHELDVINNELKRAMSEEEEVEDTEEPSEKQEDIKYFKHEVAKQAYDAYFNKTGEEEDELENKIRPEMFPVEESEEPYIISAKDFASDRSHDKVTLTYYINADIICEDIDKQIDDDISMLIGEEWREHLHDEEDGVVYVRNNKLGADYEVRFDDSSVDFVKSTLGFEVG